MNTIKKKLDKIICEVSFCATSELASKIAIQDRLCDTLKDLNEIRLLINHKEYTNKIYGTDE